MIWYSVSLYRFDASLLLLSFIVRYLLNRFQLLTSKIQSFKLLFFLVFLKDVFLDFCYLDSYYPFHFSLRLFIVLHSLHCKRQISN